MSRQRETIFLFDIPTSAGCLHEGTEQLPQHLRQSGLVERLSAIGFEVNDLGGVPLPLLSCHNDHAIRNYPSPKIVWERTERFLRETQDQNSLFLCLGGDCSIVVGTMAGMINRFGAEQIHLLYVDGDIDSIAPNPETCVGSAGMGLWLLTQASAYWGGPKLPPEQVTVIGNKATPSTDIGIPSIPLHRLREHGVVESVRKELARIPENRKIFLHLDVDVLSQSEMPAAYSPREEGLSFMELEQILHLVLSDRRLAFFEITEFVPSKDPTGSIATALIDVIARSCQDRSRN